MPSSGVAGTGPGGGQGPGAPLVVRVSGGARERGRTAGRQAADLLHRSLGFYRRFLERRGVDRGGLERLLAPSLAAAEARFPAYVEQIRGLAEGADVPFVEVFAANAWEELEPLVDREPQAAVRAPDRCTAFVLAGPEGTILGHNEQWYPGDSGNVMVLVEEPDDGPAFVSPTVVTCLPAVGLSVHGRAQAIMSLTAPDDGEGVPRVLVSRHSLVAADRDDAIGRATVEGRAGGYAHMVAGPAGEAFTIETTARRHAVLPGPDAHTNHYLDPELAAAAAGAPDSGSVSRLRRARELLADTGGTGGPERAMEILRDHRAEPQAICAHPDPPDDEEGNAIVFSMVVHLEERRMWVAAGQPCETPFHEIDVGELLAG
jgi:isopenicillin-N N-acyltransferase like protein